MIVGKHIYGSLYSLREKRAYTDPKFVEDIMREAARLSHATILDSRSWFIEGEKGGVSVLILVDESHLAIHTWREYDYATVDIYTCGGHTDPWKAWNHILKTLKPKIYTVNYADRSQLPPP